MTSTFWRATFVRNEIDLGYDSLECPAPPRTPVQTLGRAPTFFGDDETLCPSSFLASAVTENDAVSRMLASPNNGASPHFTPLPERRSALSTGVNLQPPVVINGHLAAASNSDSCIPTSQTFHSNDLPLSYSGASRSAHRTSSLSSLNSRASEGTRLRREELVAEQAAERLRRSAQRVERECQIKERGDKERMEEEEEEEARQL